MLYHFQLGIPSHIKEQLPEYLIRLRYSEHAKRAANDDRFQIAYYLPATINPSRAKLIEVETDSEGIITKVVYRIALDSNLHLCLAIAHNGDSWTVKTVWGQNALDNHSTLNKGRYATIN